MATQNKFQDSVLRVTQQMWEQSQYAKVEYNLLVDLYKKKANQTELNKSLMLAVQGIHEATGELYEILNKFKEERK